MSKEKSISVSRGLYTDANGKVVVYVYEIYKDGYGTDIDFENIRTQKQDTLDVSDFLKQYPNKIDDIIVEFS